jgi:UDP-2,3-diacylglucosamine pyrophosphatase LpxH
MIANALVLSDLHLGWTVCNASHRTLLDHLPEAAGDAELIVLNGDIVDGHRGVPGSEERELIERLVDQHAIWQREGRTVVMIEGNHDPSESPFGPMAWHHAFDGAHGERVLVLHGHRFDDAPHVYGPYERWGRHALAVENRLYRRPALRRIYPFGPGWFVGAWGLCEDRLWRPKFPARVGPVIERERADVLVHGHFHFGPGCSTIANRPAWRSGAWVAHGHLGTVDRMLRYRAGNWERIGIESGRVRVFDDGR